MQQLTAPPRDSFTAAQITGLLLGERLSITPGCELLTSSLAVSADISSDLQACTVDRNMAATVHGTCKLALSRALTWGVDLVRPYVLLGNGLITARFNLGVFALTSPERVIGASPETYDVSGWDRLYLLDRPVADTYTVTAGTGYLAAVRTAISNAGLTGVSLDGTSEGKTLPVDKTWPLVDTTGAGTPATWLRVVNDLLGDVGYRGLWADENGLFRSDPYVNPTSRAPEFSLTASGTTSIVGVTRTEVADVWATPNRWVFVQQNVAAGSAAPSSGAGIYQVDNVSNGITSQNSRGLIWAKVLRIDAADQASLQTQGDIVVASDTRNHSVLKVTSGPFPAAGHFDVFTYTDPSYNSGTPVKVQAANWSQDLFGADTSWQWEVVG